MAGSGIIGTVGIIIDGVAPSPPPPPVSEVSWDGATTTANAPALTDSNRTATFTNIPVGQYGAVLSTTARPDAVQRLISAIIDSINPDIQFSIALVDPTIDIDTPASWTGKINRIAFTSSLATNTKAEGPLAGLGVLSLLPVYNGTVVRLETDGNDWNPYADNIQLEEPVAQGFGNLLVAHTTLMLIAENIGAAPTSGAVSVRSLAADMQVQALSTYFMVAGVQDWFGTAIGLQGAEQTFYDVINVNTDSQVAGRNTNQGKDVNLDPVNLGSGEQIVSGSNVVYSTNYTVNPVAFEVQVTAASFAGAGESVGIIMQDPFVSRLLQLIYSSSGTVLMIDSDGGFVALPGQTLAANDYLGIQFSQSGNSWKGFYNDGVSDALVGSLALTTNPYFPDRMYPQPIAQWSGAEVGTDTFACSMSQGGAYGIAIYDVGTTDFLGNSV